MTRKILAIHSTCGLIGFLFSKTQIGIYWFAYAIDDGDIRVVDVAQGEKIPKEIISALSDIKVIKYAFNANFERTCLSRYLNKRLLPISWRCTLVWSAYAGLPLSLKSVGEVLNLDRQKMDEGKDLIKYFCSPCKPTKANGNRTRNFPTDAPDKWELFKNYNKRDVEVEMQIHNKLSEFPVPDFVWNEYIIDQCINDRGIKVDMNFVNAAINVNIKDHDDLMIKIQNLTGLDNPNSVVQMKEWLSQNNITTDTLSKAKVTELIEVAPPEIQKVLKIRQQLAKSSIKKYEARFNSNTIT